MPTSAVDLHETQVGQVANTGQERDEAHEYFHLIGYLLVDIELYL